MKKMMLYNLKEIVNHFTTWTRSCLFSCSPAACLGSSCAALVEGDFVEGPNHEAEITVDQIEFGQSTHSKLSQL